MKKSKKPNESVTVLYKCNSCNKTYDSKKEAEQCCLLRKINISRIYIESIVIEGIKAYINFVTEIEIENEESKLKIYYEQLEDGEMDIVYDNNSCNLLKKQLNKKEEIFIEKLIKNIYIDEEILSEYINRLRSVNENEIRELICVPEM